MPWEAKSSKCRATRSANHRECAAGNLGDKTLHPFAELGEQGAGDVASGRAKSVNTPMSAPRWQYRIVSVRPSGADIRKTRTTPLMSSSKYGALSASRWVTDPAGIRVRTEPTAIEGVEGIRWQHA